MRVENQPTYYQNNEKLLICPYCRKDIPILSLLNYKGQMNVYVKCSCLKDYLFLSLSQFINQLSEPYYSMMQNRCNNDSQKGKRYCLKCSYWLCEICSNSHFTNTNTKETTAHVLIDYEIKVKCTKHMRTFIFYCNDCNSHLCSICNTGKDHLRHTVFNFLVTNFNQIDINRIDNSEEAENRRYIKSLIEGIKSTDKNQSYQRQQYLYSIYNNNIEINNNLKLLYQYLHKTSLIFKGYPLYQISYYKSRLKFNDNYLYLGETNTDNVFDRLKKHLETKHIIELSQMERELIKGQLNGHSKIVLSLVEMPNCVLASCSGDKTIKLWNLNTNECITTLDGHKSDVNCLLELKDGRLASGSGDQTIKLWSIVTNKCLITLNGHSGSVTGLVQVNETEFASCSYDQTIKLWSLTLNQCVYTFNEHNGYIYRLIQIDDSRLASCSNDKSIKFWNVVSKQCDTTLVDNAIVQCLLQLKNGHIATGSFENIKLWNGITLKCFSVLIGHRANVTFLYQLDCSLLVSCSESIKIWDLVSLNCIRTLTEKQSYIHCVIQLNDGRLLSGNGDNSIKIIATNYN